MQELGQAQGDERRLGRGLDDDRVARDQRRRDLSRRGEQRVVPRRDEQDDADRLAVLHREGSGAAVGDELAERQPAEPAVVLEELGGLADFAPGLGARLAHLGHDELGQGGRLGADQGRGIQQDASARERAGRSPRLRAVDGGVDHCVDVGGAHRGDAADHLVGGGISDLDRLAGGRGDEPPAHEVGFDADVS